MSPHRTASGAAKRVTLKDIAAKAGVHVSTVSRALHPDTSDHVSVDLREKIQSIAKKTNYRTNSLGYALRMQRSATIGVIVPDLTNPFFPPIIRAIEHKLHEAGYTAILGDSNNDLERERLIVEKMKSRLVDGLIFATAHLHNELFEEALYEDVPVVLINRKVETDTIVSVTNDDYAGVAAALKHLRELGHRNICHLAAPQDLSTGRNRLAAFKREMRRNDLDSSASQFEICDELTSEAGEAACRKLLKKNKGVTALIAANDVLALSSYTILNELGRNCPADISVTGYNDIPFADKLSPPLTTVAIDLIDMGQKAADAMLALLSREPRQTPRSAVLAPRLIVRDSTAAPPSRK